ncbi:MAG: alpha-ketoglutarate-dependent dioxygenase AlkB [Hyphomicrobiales bacterium]
MLVLPNGVRHIPGYLARKEQEELRDEVRELLKTAPLFHPAMPRTGKKMSVRMSNCGALGWVTDKENGYRYQPTHPTTGTPWPDMPEKVTAIWQEFSAYPHPPEACLINFYDRDAKMGLHQDRDEENFDAPVISISLGETCRFRVGEKTRQGRTASIKLDSGDIVIMGGDSRLCFHGVDRIYPDTSTLLKNGGRINLTIRRVTEPE